MLAEHFSDLFTEDENVSKIYGLVLVFDQRGCLRFSG
jgi:hypothetical protein